MAQNTRLAALLLCLLVFSGCGDDDSPTAPSSNTIGSEGGTFNFAGGNVTLVFPPNAISEEITVTVQAATSFPPSSRLVDGTVYGFEPAGIQFAQPVELTIRYGAGSLSTGVQESELRLNEVVGTRWDEVVGSTVDIAADAVTGSINSFSAFGVLGQGVPSLELVASGLNNPVFVTAPPGDTARLFIVELAGRIRIVRGGSLLTVPFLDIQSLVTGGGEQGLFSMAFHPNYSQNGEFFVDYTDLNGDTRVARYQVSGDPDVADVTSAEMILSVAQPFSNHNGGLLAFGPDGMLYIALGDGGSQGDPQGHGQNRSTLLGNLLRIDVNAASPYAIPADNPFVGDAASRAEIWAYGLRNPWRFSFDRSTGDLYIADVGQNQLEEVDVQPMSSSGGENYGWNTMEGSTCFNPANCDPTGLVLPVLEYTHAEGCSITGGYVYRGARVPALAGHYLYGDFCSGFVRSFRYENAQAVDLRDWSSTLSPGGNISSFGEDVRGELYIITLGGSVFRVIASGP